MIAFLNAHTIIAQCFVVCPQLEVFQPFFLSLALPYSVVRGEQVAIKAIIFNYLEEPQEVSGVVISKAHDVPSHFVTYYKVWRYYKLWRYYEVWRYYKVWRYHKVWRVLQSVTLLQSVTGITRCDRYYKVWQVLQGVTLLQSVTGITRCDRYYKVWQVLQGVTLLQSVTAHATLDWLPLPSPATLLFKNSNSVSWWNEFIRPISGVSLGRRWPRFNRLFSMGLFSSLTLFLRPPQPVRNVSNVLLFKKSTAEICDLPDEKGTRKKTQTRLNDFQTRFRFSYFRFPSWRSPMHSTSLPLAWSHGRKAYIRGGLLFSPWRFSAVNNCYSTERGVVLDFSVHWLSQPTVVRLRAGNAV